VFAFETGATLVLLTVKLGLNDFQFVVVVVVVEVAYLYDVTQHGFHTNLRLCLCLKAMTEPFVLGICLRLIVTLL
jgi:hypothetical protein